MAKWKVTYRYLETNAKDKFNWPIIEVGEDVQILEDSKIQRIWTKGKEMLLSNLSDSILGISITNIERVDKESNIQYFSDEDIRPLDFTMSEEEIDIFESIKDEICGVQEHHPRFGRSIFKAMILNVNDRESYLANNIYALKREEALLHLEKVKKFYEKIEDRHIEILNINSNHVSYEEHLLIQGYLQGVEWRGVRDRNEIIKNNEPSNQRLNALTDKIKDPEMISDLLEWIIENGENLSLIKNLGKLTPENLNKLNTFSGVLNLKNCLSHWERNQENPNEEFWQKEFKENSFLVSQLFTTPVLIMNQKGYVGGKSISNSGGSITDFIFANKLTKNTSIIELKTPVTKILGSMYRNGVYHISSEISGSIVQICNYKDQITKNYYSLASNTEDVFHVYDPTCILIVGNCSKELTDKEKLKSFELFRQQLGNIQVVTFDELFEKMRILIGMFERTL
ncbi:Shedu immune nuclease family protein [Leptospira santarosai]|uniref:Shedu immune nuclease family protein n=1 Tax=Leptospira santarosai TaxID=28183 RepID=UPI0002BF7DA9|nr:Shedu immune nuclease family protein [Leptospira santarosai]EMJ48718.1 PF14082 domain protein [Leptospira santarosai str. HAI1349]MDI7228183.1 DUF4263 domain-containing protein [Leptospira santarosai]